MLNKILVDAHVEIDVNLPYFSHRGDIEKLAKRLEEEAISIREFIKDHKSLDVHDVYVVRKYEYQCEHCKQITAENDKHPECCEMAIREWASHQTLVEMGFEND